MISHVSCPCSVIQCLQSSEVLAIAVKQQQNAFRPLTTSLGLESILQQQQRALFA